MFFFSLCLTLIIVITLLPFPDLRSKKNFDLSILSSIEAIPEALANIILFLPLGVALAFREFKFLSSVFFGAIISLSIEMAQFFIPGRNPSLEDVFCNSVGTVIGFRAAYSSFGVYFADILYKCHNAWQQSKHINSALVNLLLGGAIFLAVTVFVLTAYLLAPFFPEGPYFFAKKEMNIGATPLKIGSSSDGIGYFKGAIDQVRIYDRALSAEEIQVNMKKPIDALMSNSTPGLVAAYSFEERIGDHILDISGHENNGILKSGTRTGGRFGKAVAFNGHNDEIIIPHAPILNLRTHSTLEAWVRPEVNPNGWPAVIQKGGDHYFLSIGPRSVPGGGGTFGGAIEGLQGSERLSDGVWNHIAMTYDGSILRLYVNGYQVANLIRWFQGSVNEILVNGIAVSKRSITNTDWLRQALITGEVIQLSGFTGPTKDDKGALLDIQDSHRTHILELIANGDEMNLRYHTLAAAIGFPSPEVRIGGILRNVAPVSPLNVKLSKTSDGYSLNANGVLRHGIGLTLGMGWTVLLHSKYLPGWLQEFFNMAWMAIWTFPAGFWSRTCLGVVGAILILGSSLWIIPVTTEVFTSTPLGQYAAAVLGYLSGIGIRLKT